MTESRYDLALECVQDERFHEALEHLDKEEDMELYAEVEKIASARDAISNYQDRLIDDLAKKSSEIEG